MTCAWGCFRFVFLTRKWAIKVPNFKYGWEAFISGILVNMSERRIWRHGNEGGFSHLLCPIHWSDPLGFFVVMPRLTLLRRDPSKEEYRKFKEHFLDVERKGDSFGWIGGRLVAVDYGSRACNRRHHKS